MSNDKGGVSCAVSEQAASDEATLPLQRTVDQVEDIQGLRVTCKLIVVLHLPICRHAGRGCELAAGISRDELPTSRELSTRIEVALHE